MRTRAITAVAVDGRRKVRDELHAVAVDQDDESGVTDREDAKESC